MRRRRCGDTREAGKMNRSIRLNQNLTLLCLVAQFISASAMVTNRLELQVIWLTKETEYL
jgi:hypothetical protein